MSRQSGRLVRFSAVLAFLLFAILIAGQDRGKKQTPANTATINPTEAAAREQAAGAPQQPKPVQNEVTVPHDHMVPPGAIGATFNAGSSGMKIKPDATAQLDIKEIERREKAAPEKTQKKKKVENEQQQVIPHDLPVPPNAIGKTFDVTLPPSPESGKPPKKAGGPETPQPNFPALIDNLVSIPPDCGGAVGPNHVMTALNTQVRIQNRSGTNLSTVTTDGFFSPLVGAGAFTFDPKVLYDTFAQRWIITAPANSGAASSSLLIAVSATNDPTGTWTGFRFDVDSANVSWFDYPSIGFNHNWIVVTGNMYSISSGAFTGERVYAFDKAATYGGTATPTVFTRPVSESGPMVPAITLDDTQLTEYLVSNWNGNSAGTGRLRLFTITGTPASPVFTTTMMFPNVSQTWSFGVFNSMTGLTADFAPQSGATQLIQNNDARIHDAVFRNGSLWCAQTAFLPATTPTHTAAQWWQIDPATANVQQFGRVEDTTAAQFFAFPSIAVNAYDDVLLGYSSFSATQFPSANYSLRLHTDAPNTMRPSVQFRAGLAKYFKIFSGTQNRWGDYSSTVVDPDQFSLWSLQEYAETPSTQDRWGTEWTHVVPPTASLFVKDRVEDTGAEPDPSPLPMWESDDLWLRKNQDSAHAFAHTTENAEYRTGTSNPNYVYVEVRNRGGAPSAGTEQLTLYWAKASSGLSWPDPWNGGIYFDPGPNTMLMGGVVGTNPIPVIPNGSSTILEFSWSPPDPATYAGSFGTDQHHFCLLARVTTSGTAPFGMTFPEVTGDLYGNVQKNNHIAWKNIEVWDTLPGTSAPATGAAVFANLGTQPMLTKIRFEALDAEGTPELLKHGTIRVTPIGKMKEYFQGIRGDGIRDLGNGTFSVTANGAMLEGITLPPKTFGRLELAFVPEAGASELKGLALRVTQIEVTPDGDRTIGGQTMVFGSVKGFNVSSGKGTGGTLTNIRHWPWWLWLLIAILILLLLLFLLRRR
jgi:hypothetical protein